MKTQEMTNANKKQMAKHWWNLNNDWPWSALKTNMDQLFDDFRHHFGEFPSTSLWKDAWNEGTYMPNIDLSEDETSVHLTAEMPGMTAEDIHVSYRDQMLMIRGEKKSDKEVKEKQYTRRERSYGSFTRSVMLPCEIESDRIEATFRNGVLTLNMPKTPAAKASVKEIKVKQA